jgi:hypothetical protein
MSDSLADVRQEAKNAYKYWGVFLEVQRRRVLKHVTDASTTAAAYLPESAGSVLGSEELAVLQAMGLPLPPDLSTYLLPAMTSIASSGQFIFWAGEVPELQGSIVLNLARRLPSGSYERAELMRSAPEDAWYLLKAAEAFNTALEAYHIDVVFNAAKLWTSFHEGALPQPFVPVAAEVMDLKHTVPATLNTVETVPVFVQDEEEFRVVIESFQTADDW